MDSQDTAAQSKLLDELENQYTSLKARALNLNLTRGKPNAGQLDLCNKLDGILAGEYIDARDGDLRNYGLIDGLGSARELFAPLLGATADETIVFGNSSLTLMYHSVLAGLMIGFEGPGSAWRHNASVKFLCPVPGYDRHFAICEELGIEMINVPMTGTGPDMDAVESLLASDPEIKGMWCVPRFSNPTGVVFSDATVDRCAKLANIAGPQFRIMWDNAYALHTLRNDAPELKCLMTACREQGTEDSALIFGSTSKMSFAGAGLGYMGCSGANKKIICDHLVISTIGPDKINQARHVKLFRDIEGMRELMQAHADRIRPKFACVEQQLNVELADGGYGEWSTPTGGYFVSFDSLPGLASQIVELAAGLGVKLTRAGATFPYGRDPEDRNIRIAPTYPELQELQDAMQAFTCCVKLASIRRRLNRS